MALNPSWLDYIASAPEALASASPKMRKEWTHNSLCPEMPVSGTAWTLADKHCTERELLCTTAFGPCYFPTSALPRQAHQIPIKPLRRLSLQSHSLGPLCFYFLFAYFLLLSCSSVCMVQHCMVPSASDVWRCRVRSMVCPAQQLVSKRSQNWVLWRV